LVFAAVWIEQDQWTGTDLFGSRSRSRRWTISLYDQPIVDFYVKTFFDVTSSNEVGYQIVRSANVNDAAVRCQPITAVCTAEPHQNRFPGSLTFFTGCFPDTTSFDEVNCRAAERSGFGWREQRNQPAALIVPQRRHKIAGF